MLASSAFAEIVDHGFHVLERTMCIGPKVRTVRFFVSRLEHRHGRFAGMQYTVTKQILPQGIEQGLQL